MSWKAFETLEVKEEFDIKINDQGTVGKYSMMGANAFRTRDSQHIQYIMEQTV